MLTVTPSAAARIRELCRRPEYAAFARPGLRARVVGGGCAGFSYEVEVVDGPREGDVELDAGGVPVFVDPRSAPLLDAVTLDFRRTMMASTFEWRNPGATGTCGCGSSFSV